MSCMCDCTKRVCVNDNEPIGGFSVYLNVYIGNITRNQKFQPLSF